MKPEVKHSLDTIKVAYANSPELAADVIVSTLPKFSEEDYEKMHKILENLRNEQCEDDMCKSTVDNMRKSMKILREEHQRNTEQVEFTEKLLMRMYSNTTR